MKLKHFGTMTLATLAMVSTMTLTAFAGTWQQDTTGWWYQEDNNSYPTSTWKWIDGNNDGTAECYYFNENGYMLKNTTTPDGYTVNSVGAWVVDGQIKQQTSSLDEGMQLILRAEEKNKELTSVAANAKVQMTMTLGETTIPVTMDMDLKIKDLYSGSMKYLTNMKMNALGQDTTLTAFYTDGYYYMDMGNESRYKMAMDLDAMTKSILDTAGYSNLDASILKDIKVSDGANGNKRISASYDAEKLKGYLQTVLGDMGIAEVMNGMDITSLNYEMEISPEGYCLSTNMLIDMTMAIEGSTMKCSTKMDMTYVNPGQPVDFTLPSTEGYTELQ